MQRISRILIGIALLTASIVLIGLYISRDQSLSRLQQQGTIRIGYAIEPPYAFVEPNGEISGIFPVVAVRLTDKLKIARVEWVQTHFDALIPGLESGRFDVIAAGMYITRERANRVAFSEPLLHVQQGLLVLQGNPKRILSYQEAVSRADIRLAVLAGSIEETLLQQLGVPESQIIVVPDALTGRAAIEAGVVDGLALSAPSIRWMAISDELGHTTLAEPFEQPAPSLTQSNGYPAFAFRTDDRQLLAAWNAALTGFVGGDEYLQVMEEFGFSATELPGAITTEEILNQ